MNKDFYSEKIDAYLKDELTFKDKAVFEQMVEQDPILKSDLKLQQEIIEAICHHRKADLKLRLSNLNVDLTGSVLNPLAKPIVIGSMIVAGLISTVVFFNSPQNTGLKENASALQIEGKTEENALLKLNEEAGNEQEEKEVVSENTTSNTEVRVNPQNKENNRQNLALEQLRARMNKNPDENNKARAISDVRKNNSFKTDRKENDKGIFDGKNEASLESISAKNKLSYQYYNNELFLYNNTSKGQEIRLKEGEIQKIYLYYEKNYYELNENQIEKVELRPITNSELINKLEKARKEIYGDS